MRSRFLLCSLVALACGAQAPGDDPSACVPGEQRACACPGGGLTGAQVCADSGDRFGICFGCSPGGTAGSDVGTTAGLTDAGMTAGFTDADTGGSSVGSVGGDTGSSSEGGADTGPQPGEPGEPAGPPQAVPPAPPPDGYAVVEQVALEHPDWLAGSCVDTGGNNEFLFEVVRRLRQQDDRWGLNWKRGVIGDMSQDVVDYHHGASVSEESTDVYIIDVIVGHCGDKPQAAWIDVTQATLDADTVGMWTLAGQSL